MAGRLEDFRDVFDLEVYRRERAAYLQEAAVSSDEFAVEIRDFASESGFHLPNATGVRLRRAQGRARKKVRQSARQALSATGTLNVVRSVRAAGRG